MQHGLVAAKFLKGGKFNWYIGDIKSRKLSLSGGFAFLTNDQGLWLRARIG